MIHTTATPSLGNSLINLVDVQLVSRNGDVYGATQIANQTANAKHDVTRFVTHIIVRFANLPTMCSSNGPLDNVNEQNGQCNYKLKEFVNDVNKALPHRNGSKALAELVLRIHQHGENVTNTVVNTIKPTKKKIRFLLLLIKFV